MFHVGFMKLRQPQLSRNASIAQAILLIRQDRNRGLMGTTANGVVNRPRAKESTSTTPPAALNNVTNSAVLIAAGNNISRCAKALLVFITSAATTCSAENILAKLGRQPLGTQQLIQDSLLYGACAGTEDIIPTAIFDQE